MNSRFVFILTALAVVFIIGGFAVSAHYTQRASQEEFEILGEDIEDSAAPLTIEERYASWQRPEGPLRVGLQAGHWKNKGLPDELSRLRERGGGTRGGGKAEWEVNLSIAQETAQLLEPYGIVVDILPATIPPDYWADLFVSIHADGSTDTSVSGFKVAAPRRDLTRKGSELVSIFEDHYGTATQLRLDPNVTRNMRGYYAFNWRRYEHSIHPMTPAIIVETGFLTNASDQQLLIHNPGRSALGIANAITSFLNVDKTSATVTTL